MYSLERCTIGNDIGTMSENNDSLIKILQQLSTVSKLNSQKSHWVLSSFIFLSSNASSFLSLLFNSLLVALSEEINILRYIFTVYVPKVSINRGHLLYLAYWIEFKYI